MAPYVTIRASLEIGKILMYLPHVFSEEPSTVATDTVFLSSQI